MDEARSDTAPAGRDAPADPRGRRHFLTFLSRAFLGLWGLGALGAIAGYLKPPSRGSEVAERLVRVGPLAALRIGEGRLVQHGAAPFWIVRLDETRLVALSAVCTHLRCIVGFDKDRRILVCPCHRGRFDLAGGVLSGPPPRALPTYSVSVRAGDVFVQL